MFDIQVMNMVLMKNEGVGDFSNIELVLKDFPTNNDFVNHNN